MRTPTVAAVAAIVASLTAIGLLVSPLITTTGTAQPIPGPQIGHAWYQANGTPGADLLGQSPLNNEEQAAVALRANGTPCATFVTSNDNTQPDVLVGCYNSSGWHGLASGSGYDQLTDTPTPSELPQIAVAYDGTVFVAWAETLQTGSTKHDVRLAFFDASSHTWTGYQQAGYDVVSLGGDASNSFDLAVNPLTGMPALAWANRSTTKIHYREWNGQTWTGRTGSVDTLNTASDETVNALEPSLVLGSDGTPNVTWTNYVATGAGEVLFRRWNGTWHGYTSQGSDNLTNTPTTSEHLSHVAVSAGGVPAVVWEDAVAPDTQVHYTAWSGTSWRGHAGTAPDRIGTTGAAPSLAVAANGVPVVAYTQFTGSTYRLLATRWNGTAWGGLAGGAQPEPIDVGDATVNAGLHVALVLDSTARPHVAWSYRAGGPYNTLNVAYAHWR
ncbi:MAG: hypothetical protein U0514_02820 [Candidatus Andersenbacteria bacterium]